MKDGQCTKRFPKEFTPETVDNNDGYPAYRRRDNGHHLTVECAHDEGTWGAQEMLDKDA
jgi:hypothetical protein